jgi:hypothetical protein
LEPVRLRVRDLRHDGARALHRGELAQHRDNRARRD